jgi:RES domain
VLLYRVFPYRDGAVEEQPGHPLYVNPTPGHGRWDNPSRYRCRYLATSPEAAVGETFGNLTSWTPDMLAVPGLPGSERSLGTYRLDEEAHPLLDLDDPQVLAERGIRPTRVVVRNRPRTQGIAVRIFDEGQWAGIQWWSYHRPEWTLVALWAEDLTVVEVEPIAGHPALDDAARSLAKMRSGI